MENNYTIIFENKNNSFTMLTEITISIIIGIILGTITGLIPGIHINLISTLIVSNIAILNNIFEIKYLIIIIVSMGITHSFLDFIPSVLFGIPSNDNFLSVLPAHKMVLEGNAYEAIKLSSIGSLGGLIFSIILIPILYLFLESIYSKIKDLIPIILLIVSFALLLLDKGTYNKIKSLIVIIFSGSLGMLILNSQITDNPLLILFSGLFGISSILISLNSKHGSFPNQNSNNKIKITSKTIKAIVIGGICSTICSIVQE